MYKSDSLRLKLKHLSLPSFYTAFRTIYPFVKIRRKKSVTGEFSFLFIFFLAYTILLHQGSAMFVLP